MTTISVIICSYNRRESALRAARSLLEQTLPTSNYEVILVDNNSTDLSLEFFREFCSREPNLKAVLETRPGTSHARNAGVAQASGEILAFMDSDAVAKEDWLEQILKVMDQNPEVGGLGGPIHPFYSAPRPTWFKDEYEIRSWGKDPRYLKSGECFSGSNMVFRRDLLRVSGGFDVALGPKGSAFSLGEETALFETIWELNPDVALFYSPDVVMYHEVTQARMTVGYRLRRWFANGQSWFRMYGGRGVRARASCLAHASVDAAVGLLRALRACRKHTHWQNWAVEELGRVFQAFGRISESLALPVRMRQK